jgi:hypothetical protein
MLMKLLLLLCISSTVLSSNLALALSVSNVLQSIYCVLSDADNAENSESKSVKELALYNDIEGTDFHYITGRYYYSLKSVASAYRAIALNTRNQFQKSVTIEYQTQTLVFLFINTPENILFSSNPTTSLFTPKIITTHA